MRHGCKPLKTRGENIGVHIVHRKFIRFYITNCMPFPKIVTDHREQRRKSKRPKETDKQNERVMFYDMAVMFM